MSQTIRIGGGAGFSGDRIEPAIELAERGKLDYLVFECLAERTTALAQQARRGDPSLGYDPMLEQRIRAVLSPCVENEVKIVSNMGAANPIAAAKAVRNVARQLGLPGLRIAAVTGDDVLDLVKSENPIIEDTGEPVASMGDRVISANAYTGAQPISQALARGADIVLTGRTADPALFLGPMIHEFGWSCGDWTRLGRGTIAGHLMECAGQVCGGYFAEPGRKEVPELARLGFPIGEIDANGTLELSKLSGTGGRIDRAICTEQLLYEIHDPASYYQPDVIADFSQVILQEIAPDRVRVEGGGGREKTGRLKVSVGYIDGYVGEGQITYAGPGATARAQLAFSILRQRLAIVGVTPLETRGDLIGLNSAYSSQTGEAPEVRLRFVARTSTREEAVQVGAEVEALYLNGPAGGGGVTKLEREVVGIVSTYLPEASVTSAIELLES